MASTLVQQYIHIVFHTKCTSITMREEDLERIFDYVGGIIAYTAHWVHLSKCHSAGEISSKGARVGGIIGDLNPSADDTDGTSITDCYSTIGVSITYDIWAKCKSCHSDRDL